MSSYSSGVCLDRDVVSHNPDEQELIPTGGLRRLMLWLLFVLTQVLEFLELSGGQNGSQVI
jgi:hypothetical protein